MAAFILLNPEVSIAKTETANSIQTFTPIHSMQLFNGINLDGWQQVGYGKFKIKNGLLETESGMGLLWYAKQKFGNALIRVVYKTNAPDANSGVFVRIANAPKSPWDAVHHGYEVQICDTGDDAFDDYHRTGAIYSLAKPSTFPAKNPGEWNQYEIALQGNNIFVKLNGVLINKFYPKQSVPPRKLYSDPKRGDRPVIGYIGIQNHDHNKRPNTHVYFKEISISPIPKHFID